jgi:hypothetical protein
MDGVDAAVLAATRLGLRSTQAVVLRDTNNLVVWLAPEPVVVKVGREPRLSRERQIATALTQAGAPVIGPAPGLPGGVHEQAGHYMTFWVYMPQPQPVPDAGAFARALADLHAHLQRLPRSHLVDLPRFTEQLDEALRILRDPQRAHSLAAKDRAMLHRLAEQCLSRLRQIRDDHVLHGAAHMDNVLVDRESVVFIDFESVCLGPIEWDLAHQPAETAAVYPAPLDGPVFEACRLAAGVKTAAFCWADAERGDLREHAEYQTRSLRRVATDQ